GTRVGESGATPEAECDVGIYIGARGGLGEREAVPPDPERSKRREAEHSSLLVGLHQLGDRRADLVQQEHEQLEALDRVRSVGIVQTRRDEVLEVLAHENCSGASTPAPGSVARSPIDTNDVGAAAS